MLRVKLKMSDLDDNDFGVSLFLSLKVITRLISVVFAAIAGIALMSATFPGHAALSCFLFCDIVYCMFNVADAISFEFEREED